MKFMLVPPASITNSLLHSKYSGLLVTPATFGATRATGANVAEHTADIMQFVNNRKSARNPKKIILDNGVWELGESLSLHLLISLARDIAADTVVLPDAFRKGSDTFFMIQEGLGDEEVMEWMVAGKNVMIVPQGRDAFEWTQAYAYWSEFVEKDAMLSSSVIIALPKWLAYADPDAADKSYSFSGRKHLFSRLSPNIRHHLLGWGGVEELRQAVVSEKFETIDSSVPFVEIMAGYKTSQPKILDRPSNYNLPNGMRNEERENVLYGLLGYMNELKALTGVEFLNG